MSTLPLPIRIAAGLAVVALERARNLPKDVTEWPMTAVSQALQVSMRVQQRITELAIKGDEALASLREPEEDPPWVVFDEDEPAPPVYLRPEVPEEPAASTETADTPTPDGEHAGEGVDGGGPGVLPGYPELSLASVRGRLRVFSLDELEELLAYERGHGDRPEFVRMLTNRIATVRGA